MTYRELQNKLKNLSEEEVDLNVTILIDGEYHPIVGLSTVPPEDDDILDAGHPILRVRNDHRGV